MAVTPSRTWTRSALVVVGAALAALSLTSPASARTAVDPATLTPPPPPDFNPVCSVQGSHISCTVAFSDAPVDKGDSGISCGNTQLLLSQTRSVVGTRFYDRDGNLLSRHFREDFTGSFSNPATERTVSFVQHDTVVDDLAKPGDLTSGTTRISGSLRITAPGGGTVLTDAGTSVLDDATGDILSESRHHPFDAYFAFGDTSALAPLCAALA